MNGPAVGVIAPIHKGGLQRFGGLLVSLCYGQFHPVREEIPRQAQHGLQVLEIAEAEPERLAVPCNQGCKRQQLGHTILDALDALPKGINAGGYVGDVAVRTYVAGDAACEEDFRATPDQLAARLEAAVARIEALINTHPEQKALVATLRPDLERQYGGEALEVAAKELTISVTVASRTLLTSYL